MCFTETVFRIFVEVDRKPFLQGSDQFEREVANKFRDPMVIFIVVLTVADKNVVFEVGKDRCHEGRQEFRKMGF